MPGLAVPSGTLATGEGVALGVSGTGEAEGGQRVLLSFPGPLLWPHAESNPEGQMALSSVPGVGAEAAKGQGFSAGRARPLLELLLGPLQPVKDLLVTSHFRCPGRP